MPAKIQVGPDLKMFQILFATYTQKMVLLSQSERFLKYLGQGQAGKKVFYGSGPMSVADYFY